MLVNVRYTGAVRGLRPGPRGHWMDESYNDGQAIYRLAQAYQGKGDTENAKTWYQKMVDTYNNSRYIEIDGAAPEGLTEQLKVLPHVISAIILKVI